MAGEQTASLLETPKRGSVLLQMQARTGGDKRQPQPPCEVPPGWQSPAEASSTVLSGCLQLQGTAASGKAVNV